MKSTIWDAALAVIGAGCLIVSSCNKEETPVPVFPSEKIERTVVAGESVEITFNANQNWQITAEGDGVLTYFWIDNAGSRESSVKGSAGDQKITIVFSKEDEHDTDRVCKVLLSMGSQTQEIALLTRFKIARTLQVKVAEAFDTAFRKVDGKYVYTDVPEDGLKMITFVDEPDYQLPIKVSTNYEWQLSLPEWLKSNISEGKTGDTEILLEAVLSEKIAAGATAQIKFIDKKNTEAVDVVDVKIDPFADRVDFYGTMMDFDADGNVKNMSGEFSEGGASITVLAAEGVVVKVLGKSEQWYDPDYAAWAHVTELSSTGEGYLKKKVFSLTVDPNEGAPRVADVLVLPASKAKVGADLICNSNGDEFLDEYKPYVLGRLSQLGFEGGNDDGTTLLSLDSSYDNYKAIFSHTPESWIAGAVGTTEVYSLTYSHEWSEAQIACAKPFTSIEVLDFKMGPVKEGFWASTWNNLSKDRFKVSADMSAYQRVGAADEELVPECFVVLYNGSSIMAVIDFKYDENAKEPGDGSAFLSLVQGDGSIEKATSGDLFYYLQADYSVSEIFEANITSRSNVFKCSSAFDDVKIYQFGESGLVDAKDDYISAEGGMDNQIYIYISEGLTEATTFVVIFKSMMVNTGALILNYNPASGASAPISFLYPDYVKNATLSRYTGPLLSSILSEQWGATEDMVYELRYTGEPQMAALSVSSAPSGDAWGNWDDAKGGPSDNYWLTYEYEDKTLWVNMAELGKTDYFVWKDPMTYKPSLILVCTADAEK